MSDSKPEPPVLVTCPYCGLYDCPTDPRQSIHSDDCPQNYPHLSKGATK